MPSNDVCIGRGYQNGRYFRGYIADLHIWYHDHGHEDVHTKLFQFHEDKPELVLVDPEVSSGFKSSHNKFMSAQPDDGSIVCDRDWLRGWEKFTQTAAE